MPKGYFSDTGLLHYIMGINSVDMLKQHPIIGRSFEAFVINEIIKGLQAKSIGSWHAYHYRTKHGAEIDLILEGRFGILPIEIKYGVRVERKVLNPLIAFVENENLPFGVVINQADEILWLTPKILQIPVRYL